LPQDKENPPLVKFSCYIAAQLAEPQQTLLNDLIAKHFRLSCPFKDSEPEKSSSCNLWVVVSTGTFDLNSYSVMIYLDKKKLLETDEFIEEKEFRIVLRDKLKEAYSKLMSYLLSTNGLCEEQVWIHFILPTPLLSEAVDQYEIGDEWEKLGEEFKVVVNSWDRLRNKKALLRTKTCWKRYQDKMTRKIQCTYSLDSKDWGETNIPAIIINKEASTPHQILADAKNSKPALAILVFSPKPTPIEKKEHLNALLKAGVPTILWMRNVESKDESVDNVIRNIVCDKQLSFNELPKYIHEKRNAALKTGTSSHIGNHLVLLWDDPELCLDEQIPLRGAE